MLSNVATFVTYKMKDNKKGMSNQKYSDEQRKDFYERLAAIQMRMPENYSEIIHEREKVGKDIIRNVRHGKTINFTILAALENLCDEFADKMTK